MTPQRPHPCVRGSPGARALDGCSPGVPFRTERSEDGLGLSSAPDVAHRTGGGVLTQSVRKGSAEAAPAEPGGSGRGSWGALEGARLGEE